MTVTPFSADASAIDEDGVRALVAGLLRDGISRLVACGNTGEYYALSSAERRRVAALSVEVARDHQGGAETPLIAASAWAADRPMPPRRHATRPRSAPTP